MSEWIFSRGASKTRVVAVRMIYADMQAKGMRTLEEWIMSFDDPEYVAMLLHNLGLYGPPKGYNDDNI